MRVSFRFYGEEGRLSKSHAPCTSLLEMAIIASCVRLIESNRIECHLLCEINRETVQITTTTTLCLCSDCGHQYYV